MKEIVRAFILSKAREVFQERGFAGATMEEIASASRVSKPTLYNYFKGKRAIFLAVLDNMHDRVAERIKPYIGQTDLPFSQRLRDMTMDMADYFNRHKGLLRIVNAEMRVILDDLDGEDINVDLMQRRYFRGKIYSAVREFFHRAQLENECMRSVDPEIMAVMYIGMMGQINMHQVMGEWSEERYQSAVAAGIEIFSKGIDKRDAPGGDTGGDRGNGPRGGIR